MEYTTFLSNICACFFLIKHQCIKCYDLITYASPFTPVKSISSIFYTVLFPRLSSIILIVTKIERRFEYLCPRKDKEAIPQNLLDFLANKLLQKGYLETNL